MVDVLVVVCLVEDFIASLITGLTSKIFILSVNFYFQHYFTEIWYTYDQTGRFYTMSCGSMSEHIWGHTGPGEAHNKKVLRKIGS